jgi:hypothetical protein
MIATDSPMAIKFARESQIRGVTSSRCKDLSPGDFHQMAEVAYRGRTARRQPAVWRALDLTFLLSVGRPYRLVRQQTSHFYSPPMANPRASRAKQVASVP